MTLNSATGWHEAKQIRRAEHVYGAEHSHASQMYKCQQEEKEKQGRSDLINLAQLMVTAIEILH